MAIDKSLSDYYKELRAIESPANKLKRELVELTKMKPGTVAMWFCGNYPDEYFQDLIAKHLETPVHILFPPKQSNLSDNANNIEKTTG